MQRQSKDLLREYLRVRKRMLEERPRLFREFVKRIIGELGSNVSLILFGGHARAGLDSVEPRDYDLLIVVKEAHEIERVEKIIYKLKPRGLPVDIIVVSLRDLDKTIIRQMLRHHIVLYDPLVASIILGGHRDGSV